MNTKFRCLLLDDELPGLSYLRMLCDQIPEIEVVKAFNDPLLFLKDVENHPVDFCILDIEMPGMSGLDVAKAIPNKLIIFTTAYKEYAVEAFDINAVDYVRKPIQKERLEKAIAKVIQRLKSSKEEKTFMQWNSSQGKALIYFSQLLYVTTALHDKRDKIAILNSGENVTLKNISFDELLHVLPQATFCRINKKELIAIQAVRFFVHNEISISLHQSEEKKLFLSDNYREDFLKKIST